jgi:hypothetical protein
MIKDPLEILKEEIQKTTSVSNLLVRELIYMSSLRFFWGILCGFIIGVGLCLGLLSTLTIWLILSVLSIVIGIIGFFAEIYYHRLFKNNILRDTNVSR